MAQRKPQSDQIDGELVTSKQVIHLPGRRVESQSLPATLTIMIDIFYLINNKQWNTTLPIYNLLSSTIHSVHPLKFQ